MKLGVLKSSLPLALALSAWTMPAAAQLASETPSPLEAARQRLGVPSGPVPEKERIYFGQVALQGAYPFVVALLLHDAPANLIHWRIETAPRRPHSPCENSTRQTPTIKQCDQEENHEHSQTSHA